jgi:trigger factor
VKSVVETVSPTRVKVVTEVPFGDLQDDLSEAYREIASQVTIPGFRRGKVPPRIIDQRFGRGVVLEEAVNRALPRLYDAIIREHELRPLGTPAVEVTKLEDGELLAFTAEVDVRPSFDLPAWDAVEVTVDAVEVSDDDIESQIDELRTRFGTVTEVQRPAQDGDVVVLDLAAQDASGDPLPDAEATGISYVIGSGSLVEGIDDAVVGLAAGDATSFETTLHGTVEGTPATVKVTLQSVKERELPALDDEFAQLASEFDTVEELRADTAEQLLRAARLLQALEARDKVLQALLDSVDFPLPEGLVAAHVDEHFGEDHGEEGHREEVESEARRMLRTQLLLDEIVKAAEVGVSQAELTEYLVQRAMQLRMHPNDYVQQVVDADQIPAVLAEVARGKALAMAVEKARIVDTTGAVVDLSRLQEDGTYADPDDDADEQPVADAPTSDAGIGAEPLPASTGVVTPAPTVEEVGIIGFDDEDDLEDESELEDEDWLEDEDEDEDLEDDELEDAADTTPGAATIPDRPER